MFVKFFVYKKEVYVISPHRNYTLYKAAQSKQNMHKNRSIIVHIWREKTTKLFIDK